MVRTPAPGAKTFVQRETKQMSMNQTGPESRDSRPLPIIETDKDGSDSYRLISPADNSVYIVSVQVGRVW